jgi:hypothetical protein
VDLCPLIEQKIKNLGFFGEVGFRVFFGKKREIAVFGWPAVGGHDGEGPAVVSQWWGEWMAEVGWAYLDFREERGGGGCGCGYGITAAGREMGERGKNVT